jgi:hypothetical protein
MSAHLFARLLRRTTHHPTENPRSSRSTRLRVELLEAREVPANLVWTNTAGDGNFGSVGNWLNLDTGLVALLPPGINDDLYFDGNVSHEGCAGLTEAMRYSRFGIPIGPPGEYNSVNLVNGYSGTVVTLTGFTTRALTIESGALAQPLGSLSDVRVSQFFDWTGGVVGVSHANTSHPGFIASDSTLYLMGSSLSIIDPSAGGTVATGSTLSFENTNGIGSTATFHSGTVNFVGGAGVVIDALCTVTAETKPAAVTFVDTPQPGSAAKYLRVKAGGKMYVRSEVEATGGTFDSAIPVMNYGLFQVEKNATAVIRGAVSLGNPATDPSFYQDSETAAIKIENGSKLVTDKGLSFLGGTLATLAKANPPQGFVQKATIAGKVSLSSGHVYINQGTDPHVFGTLVFESDVWLGAVTLHVVVDGRPPGTGDAGKSDLFDFRACLRDGLAQPVLSVKTINVPEGGVNQNQTWEFVKAAHPITAPKPTVVSETEGVTYQVIDVDQNRGWWLKPTT